MTDPLHALGYLRTSSQTNIGEDKDSERDRSRQAVQRIPGQAADRSRGAGYAAGRGRRLTRRGFTGCTGSDVQLAMDRAHSRALVLSVMPGNSRRTSMAADN